MRSAPTYMPLHSLPKLEMWGGVECTVNRVGDRYFDQIARTCHMSHLDDLDRFADLGLKALRVPVLWEHVQPERGAAPNWNWTDQALERLRHRGVRPIVGLLHHGFGPHWIDARAPEFAEQLADYARMVAERYPWIDAYTPTNEPLTTARFSGLYGHWYPHARDSATFARLFVAQLSATARAMREIRRVNSAAQLIQTEDLGKVESTPALASQRDFENERRWLTWDVLGGRVTRTHACWEYLCEGGSDVERELLALADAPCAPNVIGINHYVTSERYLDERVERYSLSEIGGNGREVYADIAQVEVPSVQRVGISGLLHETWERYHLPIAVTECHIGCTREEQMRWLHEVWQATTRARAGGIDVRAVTSWALLGSHDWNSLVTRETDYYEPGVFDVRGPVPRPTAIAAMVRALATEGRFHHPVLATPGWWNRGRSPFATHLGARTPAPPILIVEDGNGHGRELAKVCDLRGLEHAVIDRDDLDAGSGSELGHALDRHRPWAVIDAAADPDLLAEECERRGLLLVSYSPHAPDANATLDMLLDDSCRQVDSPEESAAVA
ncbi:MAG: dTDP-4-dehydrorhamnose reductase [Gemmatimonadetes bacterium]|nr:dTDP-4-dehydrorhamnose reductase [Gemmatimonadota bacterium]